jgi:hypothetical protein
MGTVQMPGGWLPSHIKIGHIVFERYGQVNAYRYVMIHAPVEISADDVEFI